MVSAPDVTIRKMREPDLARVIEILSHWGLAPREPSADCLEVESTGLDQPGAPIVALVKDQIVGSASYILHGHRRAETGSLAVDPAWRGTGIGAQLQQARLAELKALGIEEVFTETDRPEVAAWYVRKFGYRVTGTRRKKHAFSRADVDHWTVLTLDLRGGSPVVRF